MKIPITGHKGFIGSWLTYSLATDGHEIFGIDNKTSYGERLYDEAGLSKFVTDEADFDVTDFTKAQEYVKAITPNVVIHLAGQAIIPRAFADPIGTFFKCCRHFISG